MANKKDKFAKLQQSGGIKSFQETMLQTTTTVAAIERQQDQASPVAPAPQIQKPVTPPAMEAPRFMRLPNPQIPLNEYNLVSQYISGFSNMTRQDFVELAILEKLHKDGGLPDEYFNARFEEIRGRLPRGQRKGTKQTSK